MRFAGETAAAKRAGIAAGLAADGVDACVLTAPDSIAWLLNIRGGDVDASPLPLAFAVIGRDGRVEAVHRSAQGDRRDRAPLGPQGHGQGRSRRFGPALDTLGRHKRTVRADPASAPEWIFRRLARAGGDDP